MIANCGKQSRGPWCRRSGAGRRASGREDLDVGPGRCLDRLDFGSGDRLPVRSPAVTKQVLWLSEADCLRQHIPALLSFCRNHPHARARASGSARHLLTVTLLTIDVCQQVHSIQVPLYFNLQTQGLDRLSVDRRVRQSQPGLHGQFLIAGIYPCTDRLSSAVLQSTFSTFWPETAPVYSNSAHEECP